MAPTAWRAMAPPRRGPVIARGPAERLQAWLMTGPAGHLWSVVADLAAFAACSLTARVRERLRRRQGHLGED